MHAERLARAGLRVVVVEQTETPDQLKIRNEERRAAGKTKACLGWFTFCNLQQEPHRMSKGEDQLLMFLFLLLEKGVGPRVLNFRLQAAFDVKLF